MRHGAKQRRSFARAGSQQPCVTRSSNCLIQSLCAVVFLGLLASNLYFFRAIHSNNNPIEKSVPPILQDELDPVPTWNDSSWEQSYAFFYNIYCPANIAQQTVFDVLREQFDAIGASDARLMYPLITVYYNTIGNGNLLMPEYIQQTFCNKHNISCVHMEHFNQAHEYVTLQRLYDHCRDNRTARVSYLHTKGMLNPIAWNGLSQVNWRMSATAAIASASCMRPPNETCNVCALLTQIVPFTHAPGNFFAASCEYVTKLVEPFRYQSELERIARIKQAITAKNGRLVSNLFGDSNQTLGLDRYGAEQWAYSHPTLRPCDVSVAPKIEYWQRRDRSRDPNKFDWAMFPRPNNKRPAVSVPKSADARMREYYLLPGFIFKWSLLYHELPPSDSFFYDYMFDGAEWKDAVENYGLFAGEIMAPTFDECNRSGH